MSFSYRYVGTAPGGGVEVMTPSIVCIGWMERGGRWPERSAAWLEAQITRRVAAGHEPEASRRLVMALAHGGCSASEALAILRDYSCAHRCRALELWHVAQLPDRWFRDAWRRGDQGGPIWIDLEAARAIQAQRIADAAAAHNERERRADAIMQLLRPTNGPALVALDVTALRRRIIAARDAEELRAVWPADLARPDQKEVPA